MSDDSARLKEKTVQVTMLNQKMEALQTQLSGATRRNTQLAEQIKELQEKLSQKDYEIQSIQMELDQTKTALESVGQQMQGIQAKETLMMGKKKPVTGDSMAKEELQQAEVKIARLQGDIKKLSEAATSVILKREDGLEKLSETVKLVGDMQHRIFTFVMEQRAVKKDELASVMLAEISEINEAVDSLQAIGEVVLTDGNTIIPAKKYREMKIPVDEWQKMAPSEIFDSLESVVEKAEGAETIVEALEMSVDIIEQKLARGGALIFQMRRTAGDWKRQEGNVEELRYTIKDWKSRADSLS